MIRMWMAGCATKIQGMILKILICGMLLIASSAQAQTQAEMQFAHNVLNALQPRSIAESREYCGYLAIDTQGQMVATDATPGDESGCEPIDADPSLDVFASYHTHGGYLADYDNEYPSSTDVEGDADMGINGYISTPGGRLWFVDGRRRTASQICPSLCMIIDPENISDGPVPRTVTLHQLRARD